MGPAFFFARAAGVPPTSIWKIPIQKGGEWDPSSRGNPGSGSPDLVLKKFQNTDLIR